MSAKPLIKTNPHLRDAENYRKALSANVASSTAIETDRTIEAITRTLNGRNKAASSKKRRASSR